MALQGAQAQNNFLSKYANDVPTHEAVVESFIKDHDHLLSSNWVDTATQELSQQQIDTDDIQIPDALFDMYQNMNDVVPVQDASEQNHIKYEFYNRKQEIEQIQDQKSPNNFHRNLNPNQCSHHCSNCLQVQVHPTNLRHMSPVQDDDLQTLDPCVEHHFHRTDHYDSVNRSQLYHLYDHDQQYRSDKYHHHHHHHHHHHRPGPHYTHAQDNYHYQNTNPVDVQTKSELQFVDMKQEREQQQNLHITLGSQYSERSSELSNMTPFTQQHLDHDAISRLSNLDSLMLEKSLEEEDQEPQYRSIDDHHPSHPQHAENITAHESSHSDCMKNFLSCPHCDALFSNKRSLTGHISKRHPDQKAYACASCDSVFTRRIELTQHEKQVHRINGKFQCLLCDKSFTEKFNLNKHVKLIHERQRAHKCSICKTAFSQKDHLRMHILTVHEKRKPFECHTCGKTFGWIGVLNKHILLMHEKKRPFSCSKCPAAFQQKSHLQKHFTSIHESPQEYACEVCGFAYSKKANLVRHQRVMHNIASAN